MGTLQRPDVTTLDAARQAELRAELLRQRAHHAGTLRFDVMTAAIERLDAGTYGTCLACDAEIPYERLAVLPETDRCIACSVSH